MGHDTFTPRELDVMSILWDLGSATVAEVRERMADDLAYTSVLSVLQTLEDKGYADHEEEGRAYRYRPLVDWRAAGRGELRRLLSKIFKGSPELLLAQLVSDRALDETSLRRIRELVDERLGPGGGDPPGTDAGPDANDPRVPREEDRGVGGGESVGSSDNRRIRREEDRGVGGDGSVGSSDDPRVRREEDR